MGKINALVPENAADLINSVEATDDELLEIEFWCDTEVQIKIKVVVVSSEGLGSRATSNHTCDRCFDFKEAQRVKEASDVVDDTTASIEDATSIVGKNEVEITLSISRFLVFQTEMARRKLVQIRSEKDHLRG